MKYDYLLPFCNTERQRQFITELHEHGNPTAVATAKGGNDSAARAMLRKLKARASSSGVAPECDMDGSTVPEGFYLEKSTVHTKDGGTTQRWDRIAREKEQILRETIEAIELASKSIPPIKRIPSPKRTNKRLLAQYTWADLHYGMRAWEAQGGADWNLEEAEEQLASCMSRLMEQMPNAETALLLNVGDLTHFDGMKSVTPKHGHVLDSDGVFGQIQHGIIRICVDWINKLLDKHKKVIVVMAPGNHDPALSGFLRACLPYIYASNPRVEIVQGEDGFFGITHGENFIGTHHGDVKKFEKLVDVFEAHHKYFRDFGMARRAYLHTGHLHSEKVIAVGKTRIEQHSTICAKDSHSSLGGYPDDRKMKAILYDIEDGEVATYTVRPTQKRPNV